MHDKAAQDDIGMDAAISCRASGWFGAVEPGGNRAIGEGPRAEIAAALRRRSKGRAMPRAPGSHSRVVVLPSAEAAARTFCSELRLMMCERSAGHQ